MQNIGIFGGSFNPVHNEHFALCEYLLKKLELNKIILVPNAAPPHKSCNRHSNSPRAARSNP